MRFLWSSDRLEPELRYRCSWEKLVTVADFKRHKRQKCDGTQRFFWWYSETKRWIIKENLKLVLSLSGKGRYLTSKLSSWMNCKVLKHRHLFSFVDWQAVDQIDWYLRWTLTKDVIICMQDGNGEICMVNTKKNQGGGVVYLLPEIDSVVKRH